MFVDSRGVTRLTEPNRDSWQSRELRMWVTGFNKADSAGNTHQKLADYAYPGYPIYKNSGLNMFGYDIVGSSLGLPCFDAQPGNTLIRFEEVNPPDLLSGAMTWSMWFEAYGTLGTMTSISGGTNPNRPLLWNRVNASNFVQINFRTTSSFRTHIDPTSTDVVNNGPHHLIVEFDFDSGTLEVWLDTVNIISVVDSTISSDGFQFTTYPSAVSILNAEGSDSFDGKLIDWRWNNTKWSPGERLALYAEGTRWDLFRPLLGRNYFVPTGEETATGTAGLALSILSMAATGVQEFTGTGTLALVNAIMAATGTSTAAEAVTGTAALTLLNAIMAATGVEAFTATATVVLTNAIMSATGAETFTATAAAVLTALSMSATGIEELTATATLALSGAIMAASGLEEFTATSVITLANATMAASGIHTENVSGTAALLLAALSMSAQGSLPSAIEYGIVKSLVSNLIRDLTRPVIDC